LNLGHVLVVSAALVVTQARLARAEVKASALIGDHMVVAQSRPIWLSGTAVPGEPITAALAGKKAATRTDAAGRWQLTLPALPAGGPFVLTIAGSTTLTFTDVWAGEVWVAAGQSNMELPLMRSSGAAEAVAGGCPGIRLFMVAHRTAAAPVADVDGQWQPCDAATAAGFSAVGFHFGREIHRALGVPVGLIQAAVGGTPAEAWTPRPALLAEPSLKPMVDALDLATRDPRVREERAQKLAAWEARSFIQDTGNRGEALGFARPQGGGAGWSKMEIPQLWENAGLKIDGAVWFRREVTLPAEWAGRDLALSLGALDDFDVTYWNGERVGATGAETPQYWSAARHYTVPGRLARAGRNVIAVRVFDHYGSGGFAGTAAQLTVGPAGAGSTALPLAGTWSFKIERRLKPVVVDFATRPQLPGADDIGSPSTLWNGMIAPLTALPVAGVIWYQGESNTGRADQYRTLFPTLIRAWRAAWGAPALPFLYAQLPNYGEPGPRTPLGDSPWAELREGQAAALQQPRTAMVVTLDIGESTELHPRNKQEVGRRLALAALKVAYGRDVIATGPAYASVVRAGPALRVRFTGVTSGLTTADGRAPRGFMIAGADRAWHVAEARIDGDTVIVSHPEVAEPIAVRYGWANDPENTLRNHADLPAAPFRSDDWPAITATATAP
jgi:sialate O-acetylesterase